MIRTRADALALVNWKGVFYERYLLDRHVTALEGANGAGKTTVMIAAYVVLLPDMSRLRFTNLGETGATGGDRGIWGRLGQPGRPSYAVLDFALPAGARLLAGVHLERKGEPSVEPTPFIVSGLGPDVRLQDLLLVTQGDEDVVPELPELAENAARLGGRLQVFASVRGVLRDAVRAGGHPAAAGHRRGAQQAQRHAPHEHDRRDLARAHLRAARVPAQGGRRPGGHPPAHARQPRRLPQDAHGGAASRGASEEEIGGVFEAGHLMFAAAFLATRERADDLAHRVAEAEAAHAAAAEARAKAASALEETAAALEAVERARADGGQALEAAVTRRAQLRGALEALQVLQDCAARLCERSAAADAAARVRGEAEEERRRRREGLQRAQEGHRRAADGLATSSAESRSSTVARATISRPFGGCGRRRRAWGCLRSRPTRSPGGWLRRATNSPRSTGSGGTRRRCWRTPTIITGATERVWRRSGLWWAGTSIRPSPPKRPRRRSGATARRSRSPGGFRRSRWTSRRHAGSRLARRGREGWRASSR